MPKKSKSYYSKVERERAKSLLIKSKFINAYEEVLYDDVGEMLLPNNEGDLFRVLDLCWVIVRNDGNLIAACEEFVIHPIKFMAFRLKFPPVDDLVMLALELSGEEDIRKAAILVEGLTPTNLPVTEAKVKFYLWRGKQRYAKLYGEKRGPGLQILNQNINGKSELAGIVRGLEANKAPMLLEHQPAEQMPINTQVNDKLYVED